MYPYRFTGNQIEPHALVGAVTDNHFTGTSSTEISQPKFADVLFGRVLLAVSFAWFLTLTLSGTVHAQSIAAGQALWTAQGCNGCHGPVGSPDNRRRNAGNSVGVIDAAISTNAGGFMNSFSALTATERQSLALFLGTFVTPNPQAVTVAFNGSVSVSLNNMVTTSTGYSAPVVTNNVSTVTAPTRGTLGAYSINGAFDTPPTVTYTHTAGSCAADSFQARGTGTAASTTSTRTFNVTVTPPTAPTSGNATNNIAYSTSATALTLALGGGTSNSVSVGALSGGAGTLSVVGNTVSYTASSSVYAASQTFTYQAVGPCATSAAGTITLNVAAPPVPTITSLLTATGNGGNAFSYQITAANAPTGFNATGLPTGLSVNPLTGLISGTPTQTGMFPVTLSASNGTGTGPTASLMLTINLLAPVITSSLAVGATNGSPFSYQITASNLPASFNATGLPTGLMIDTVTGLITGSPTVLMGGPVNVMISATNATNTDTKTLVITVVLNPPTVTSPNTASGTAGVPFSYQITASGFPTGFNATGLPGGLTVNTMTGLISGTPSAAFAGPITVTASNGAGPNNLVVTLTIVLLAPTVTSAATANGTQLAAFSYQITANNLPASYGATGLPAGLSVNTMTGLISGTPGTGGTFNIMVSATNATGTGSKAVAITISNIPPPSTSNLNVGVTFGTATTIDLGAAAGGSVTSAAITSQPLRGTVTLNGLIATYTPNAGYFGPDNFSFTATGIGGTSLPATVNLQVGLPAAPVATARTATVTFGTATVINLASSITGVVNSIAITSQPTHGTVTFSGLSVTYTPAANYFGDDSFSYKATGPGGTSEAATVSVTVGTLAPTARAVRFILPLNTPTTMDMAPFISGSAISGVKIATQPKFGSASVNGTKVTYTPNKDFFGDDSFTYAAFGNAGSSPPAAVSISVVGRPDPTKDATVASIGAAQTNAADQFARSQIGNFQNRMEFLHRGNEPAVDATFEKPGPGKRTATAKADTPSDAAAKITLDETAPSAQSPGMKRVANVAAKSEQYPQRSNSSVPLIAEAYSLLTSRSLNLASLSDASTTSSNAAAVPGSVNFWTSGNVSFGTRDATGSRNSLDFTTGGVSFGVDRRFSKEMALGMGIGYGHDRTDIGTDGSRSNARAVSLVGYGSYQPQRNTFIDAMLGYGSLDFKTQRYVQPIKDFARDNRDGYQLFGSISGGYEYRNAGVLFSPYARLDYITNHLKQSSETGVGSYALTYFSQTTPSMQGALGLRGETIHQTNYGWASPRARIEYRHEFQGERLAPIGYADLPGGTQYLISSGPIAKNALMLGLGADFQTRSGVTVGLDYQFLHTSAKDSSQGLRLTVSQQLDGHGGSLFGAFPLTFGKLKDIQADGGFVYDDNINRSKSKAEKLGDRIYSANIAKGFKFKFEDLESVRAFVTVLGGGEAFDKYHLLDRVSAGVEGKVQYRGSAGFDAITYSLFAEGSGDYYRSTLRRGLKYAVGLSARQELTDRIGVYAAIAHNERYARSAVFNSRFNSIRVNADYSMNKNDTLYLTGEYRRGQIVSTGFPSLDNLNSAEVFVLDDAYVGGQYVSYRFDSTTVISTVGYNMGFGPRHSLDLSWRRAQSTPEKKSNFTGAGTNYVTDQYSVVYLVRF